MPKVNEDGADGGDELEEQESGNSQHNYSNMEIELEMDEMKFGFSALQNLSVKESKDVCNGQRGNDKSMNGNYCLVGKSAGRVETESSPATTVSMSPTRSGTETEVDDDDEEELNERDLKRSKKSKSFRKKKIGGRRWANRRKSRVSHIETEMECDDQEEDEDEEDGQKEHPLPVPMFKEIDDYYKLTEFEGHSALVDNSSYIQYVASSPTKANKESIRIKVENSVDEVEYEIDELDEAWLNLVNEKRKNLPPVSPEIMELLIDRFEKESFLQMPVIEGGSVGASQDGDEEAVCCICLNGECLNTDMIIFCDLCNIAVHQECYGVPYIPEGQWLCRKCLVSPSREVECIFCPNKGGAFKRTDNGRWVHVACALWIPEVCFANKVFMEPVIGTDRVPEGRRKLTCFVCKCKGIGACIQCHKPSCYVAFHVTCAQFAKIYMVMDYVFRGSKEVVRKIAYCKNHAPAHHNFELDSPTIRQRMKECRRMLAENREAKPTISVPSIQRQTIIDIQSLVEFPQKEDFVTKLLSYWKLKRLQRMGVPLLQSLKAVVALKVSATATDSVQDVEMEEEEEEEEVVNINNVFTTPSKSTPTSIKKAVVRLRQLSIKSDGSTSISALTASAAAVGIGENASPFEVYKRLYAYRQHLERTRMIVELCRNREKDKRKMLEINEEVWGLTTMPFSKFLVSIVDNLLAMDANYIFTQPVDTTELPEYRSLIAHPMDLSTMRERAGSLYYGSLPELKMDFNLMIDNCLLFNDKKTIFYKAALRLREEGILVFQEAEEMIKKIKFDSVTGLHSGQRMQRKVKEPNVAVSAFTITQNKKKSKVGPDANAPIDKKKDELLYNEIAKKLEEAAMDVSTSLPFSQRIGFFRGLLSESITIQNPQSRKKLYNAVLKELVKTHLANEEPEGNENEDSKGIIALKHNESPNCRKGGLKHGPGNTKSSLPSPRRTRGHQSQVKREIRPFEY